MNVDVLTNCHILDSNSYRIRLPFACNDNMKQLIVC